MNKFTIIRDTREQNGWDWQSSNIVNSTITAKLDTGDYSIQGLENILCIERKGCVGELAKNIVEERFVHELERMSKYKYSFLLCEFDMYEINTYPLNSGIPRKILWKIKVKKPFIMKKISEMQVKYGIHVVFCGSDIDDAKMIALNIMKRVYEQERLSN